MATYMFDSGVKALLGNQSWVDATEVNAILVGSTYSADKATDVYVGDIATLGELSGTGYTGGHGGSGRKALTSRACNISAGYIRLDAADLTWSAINAGTINGVVIAIKGASDAASILIGFIDLTDTVTNGGDITIQWHADGIFEFNNN